MSYNTWHNCNIITKIFKSGKIILHQSQHRWGRIFFFCFHWNFIFDSTFQRMPRGQPYVCQTRLVHRHIGLASLQISHFFIFLHFSTILGVSVSVNRSSPQRFESKKRKWEISVSSRDSQKLFKIILLSPGLSSSPRSGLLQRFIALCFHLCVTCFFCVFSLCSFDFRFVSAFVWRNFIVEMLILQEKKTIEQILYFVLFTQRLRFLHSESPGRTHFIFLTNLIQWNSSTKP